MNSIGLSVLLIGVLFASISANQELSKAIKICREKFPLSETRIDPSVDFIKLEKIDKCHLYCILSAQKVIVNGVLNVDSLPYSTNDELATKIKTRCGGSIHSEDKCEFAAKVQKCIQDVLKTTPIA